MTTENEAEARRARLAAALRENLRRRKAQGRAAAATDRAPRADDDAKSRTDREPQL